MYPVPMFRGVERKDFVAFGDENIDADCSIYVFEFRCVCEFEKELKSCGIEFMHERFVFCSSNRIITKPVYMRENAPEETIIVFEVLDIKDPFTV